MSLGALLDEDPYAKAVLGLEDVSSYYKGAAAPSGGDVDKADLLGKLQQQLLCADAHWQRGEFEKMASITEAAQEIASTAAKEGSLSEGSLQQVQSFAAGLGHLVAGELQSAYDAFLRAATAESTFAASKAKTCTFMVERSVNIAFWMACSGKMLHAASTLDIAQPYAGGLLAFAQYMVGEPVTAETTARKALAQGNCDPWTLHAVAHALYSQGKSEECANWIREYQKLGAFTKASTFMRTHMDFHLALCLMDSQDADGLQQLINQDLWGCLRPEEKEDYWCATGLLNVLWKAELRGMGSDARESLSESFAAKTEKKESQKWADEALAALGVGPGLSKFNVKKSMVFTLCTLRWHHDLDVSSLSETNEVFSAVASAVVAGYQKQDWQAAAGHLAGMVHRLPELGASPEQREVVAEFLPVAALRAAAAVRSQPQTVSTTAPATIDVEKWLADHRRPGVAFYDSLARQL